MDCMEQLEQSLILGRAAVGIYLILKQHGLEGRKILVPANICYAAIYPAIYAGMTPCFCDVDRITGNMTPESLKARWTPEAAAAIVPHMYGNPVAGLKEIADFCRQHQVLLIEDCASAMGAETPEYPLGQMGDYGVFSTGYSKTLDLGGGGLVWCREPERLQALEQLERTLPPEAGHNEKDQQFFSRLYRCLRNEGCGSELEKHIYGSLGRWERDWYLFSISQPEKERIRSQLSQLPRVIRERRAAQKYYEDRLAGTGLALYPCREGSVPWRFSLFAPPELRREIIAGCLAQGLPVSDWYPRVTPLFGDPGDYPGARWHEEHILNFPLLTPEKDRICSLVSRICSCSRETGSNYCKEIIK